MHRSATLVLSLALLGLGLLMVLSTVLRGGGPLAYGVILGTLFSVAGGVRLWVTTRQD